ncbi:MAG: hypothetical protein HQ561_10115, partial [Desulfobacteraceae bacterium]|nr:hypothetical protein [Desulfobacteraceae bacterium]
MGSKLLSLVFGRVNRFQFFWIGVLCVAILSAPAPCLGRIYIDINEPSIPKFNIAIPDFKNLNENKEYPKLAQELAGVISNDLYLSGYFNPMDKEAFLEEKDAPLTAKGTRFKDWT